MGNIDLIGDRVKHENNDLTEANKDHKHDNGNINEIDDGKNYEHDNSNINENDDESNDENKNVNNDEIGDPVGHGGSPIILMRKNPQNSSKQQRDKNPPLTATKKFHQLIVKSPLRVRGDTDQSDDIQLTKEGETMTFYLD